MGKEVFGIDSIGMFINTMAASKLDKEGSPIKTRHYNIYDVDGEVKIIFDREEDHLDEPTQ